MLAKQCYLLSLRETFSFPTHFSSLSIWSGPHIAMVCIAGCWILPLNPGLCNTLSLLHAKDFSSICIWRKYFSSGTASASSIRIKETCFYWKVHLCNARVSCAAIYNRFPTPSLFPKYWWNCVMMNLWSLRKVVYRARAFRNLFLYSRWFSPTVGSSFAWLEEHVETSQELRMLSRSLSDCWSLTLNAMIQVLLFVSNSQLCHWVTKSLNRS